MEEWRSIGAGIAPAAGNSVGIVEHELDMVRTVERRPAVAERLLRILNWLMPSGRPVGPPMRSVGRELEEAYPSHDH